MFKALTLGLALLAGTETLQMRHQANGIYNLTQKLTFRNCPMNKKQQMHSLEEEPPPLPETVWLMENKMANTSGINMWVKKLLSPSQRLKQIASRMEKTVN